MNESSILLFGFITAASLTLAFYVYAQRIQVLERYATQLLDDCNTLMHENKMLAEDVRNLQELLRFRLQTKTQ